MIDYGLFMMIHKPSKLAYWSCISFCTGSFYTYTIIYVGHFWRTRSRSEVTVTLDLRTLWRTNEQTKASVEIASCKKKYIYIDISLHYSDMQMQAITPGAWSRIARYFLLVYIYFPFFAFNDSNLQIVPRYKDFLMRYTPIIMRLVLLNYSFILYSLFNPVSYRWALDSIYIYDFYVRRPL